MTVEELRKLDIQSLTLMLEMMSRQQLKDVGSSLGFKTRQIPRARLKKLITRSVLSNQ